jgi:hypothetical protein
MVGIHLFLFSLRLAQNIVSVNVLKITKEENTSMLRSYFQSETKTRGSAQEGGAAPHMRNVGLIERKGAVKRRPLFSTIRCIAICNRLLRFLGLKKKEKNAVCG